MSLVVSVITGLSVFLAVLLKPVIKIRGRRISTYWPLSLLGAILILSSGEIPLHYLISELTSANSINPLKILILFFSMTSLSVYLDEVGFFRYLAALALRKAGGRQSILFGILYLVVSILTVFTSNDIVVLTFTPFICFFAKNAAIDPLPYLFAEFVASNTWSMLLLIGNPTNIYLASSLGIDFLSYLSKMWLPTLFGGITSFLLLYLIFRKRLFAPIEVTAEAVEIEDKLALSLGVAHLGLCTLLLALSSYLPFEMYLITALFALSLFSLASLTSLVRKRSFRPIKASFLRLPYELIPFILSMFVLVLSLRYTGVTDRIAGLLVGLGNPILAVGISSFFVSNIINNIPMSVLYSSILSSGGFGASTLPAVYAAIVGSNLGAYFTPVGALAGIMWASILRRLGVKLSFKRFVLFGAAVAIPTLLMTLLGLFIVF